MEKLQWNKKIFGTDLELTRGNEMIASIRWQNMLSSRAQATFFGKNFLLSRDIFFSRIEIFDAKDQALLGRMSVNPFNPQTDIIINGKRFELEMKNFWQSRWTWKFNGADIITFTSNELLSKDKGDIELFSSCNEEVEILILLGLSMRNQFILIILFILLLALFIIL
jgi:hypothetical protein